MGPGKATREMRQTFNNMGQYYDPSGIRSASEEGQSFVESSGRQTADNAAREYVSRNMANGTDSSMAGLVRAQALLPALKAKAEMGMETEDKVAALKAKEGEAASTLAAQIGNTRTSYLSNLQGYMGKMQEALMRQKLAREQMTQNQNQFDASLDLDRDKFDFSKDQAGKDDLYKRIELMGRYGQPTGTREVVDWQGTADPTHPMMKKVGVGNPFDPLTYMMSSLQYGN